MYFNNNKNFSSHLLQTNTLPVPGTFKVTAIGAADFDDLRGLFAASCQ